MFWCAAAAWICLASQSVVAFCGSPVRPSGVQHNAATKRLVPQHRTLYMTASSGGRGLIVGINKYSHDSAVCIISPSGEYLFAGEKERLTRKKHDGGDTAELLEHALESIGAGLQDVELVVSNNHHFRVAPFEERLPWSVAMGHYPASYLDDHNLVPGAKHLELSHHMAHAWSVIPQAPFESGLVVVMDGMGDKYSTEPMEHLELGRQDLKYFSDEMLEKGKDVLGKSVKFQQVPEHLSPHRGYREAESVYLFDKAGSTQALHPLFKRWTEERSPPELYNHGFENMESLGAVYSRISSHIFGDWNACGKVMGLAPWHTKWTHPERIPRLIEGAMRNADGPVINWDVLRDLPHVNKLKDKALRPFYAALAARVQDDLETLALEFLQGLKESTEATNLCLCGGVALNSVLNGKVLRESGFNNVYIPSHPGDEGIAVGCANFGLWHSQAQSVTSAAHGANPTRWRAWLPYQGKGWSAEELEDELEEWAPWIEYEDMSDDPNRLIQETAQAIAGGEVVAWFQGRSEFGPRALGSRSFLADPRNASMVEHINANVKQREDFRPFAPSVLAGEAGAWFLDVEPDSSPYMSITAPTTTETREKIPAVCHVDGSSRLQTVRKEDNPLYHRLISAFYKLTGVPMVLNTSFNIKGEPIVDSPKDALQSFLDSKGAVGRLVMGDFVVRRKPFPLDVDAEGLEEAMELGVVRQGEFLSETLAAADGEPKRVRVMTGAGRWVELQHIVQLEILESLDGQDVIAEVLENFEDPEEEMDQTRISGLLRDLFEKRLIAVAE